MEMGHTKEAFDRRHYGRYERTALQIFYYISNYEMLSYIFECQRDNVLNKIEEIEKGIKRWDKKIPLEIKMVLATALKLGYYATGDLENAKRQAQFLIQNKNSSLRLDAYKDDLTYHMIFIFEQNDMELLKKESLKIYDYFKRRYGEVKEPDTIMKKISRTCFYNMQPVKRIKAACFNHFKQNVMERYKADKMIFWKLNTLI